MLTDEYYKPVGDVARDAATFYTTQAVLRTDGQMSTATDTLPDNKGLS